MELVLATTNMHKLREIRKMMPYGFKIRSLDDIGFRTPIEETGRTFRQNAILKAETVFKSSGLPCIADDSGLEVDHLEGRPGVYSARFAGPGATDDINNEKLLDLMRGISNRSARYIAVVALVSESGIKTFNGVVEGKLSSDYRGKNGFGYDPLFIPHGYSGTFGELDPAIKSSISHRSKAVKALCNYLKEMQ